MSFTHGEKINEVRIADNKTLKKHMITYEQCYKKAVYYDDISYLLKTVYEKRFDRLAEFTIALIESICRYMGLKTKIVKSSDLEASGKKSEFILSICKQLGADVYLSGTGGLGYLKKESFDNEKIDIETLNYNFKQYKQINSNIFVEKLSIIDLLFNEGKNSVNFL